MVKSVNRPTKIMIDSQAIIHNITEEIKRLPAGTEAFAVVKANAYGHGSIGVAKLAEIAGVTGFCVATVDEGMELREAGITAPILVLSVIPISSLKEAINYDLSITISCFKWLPESLNYLNLRRDINRLKVHLKVDTGMNRIGFKEREEFLAGLTFLDQHQDKFELEGIFTHFATADKENDHFWQEQNDRFRHFLDLLPKLPRYVHSANTSSALWHKSQLIGNMVRLGIGIYGQNPAGERLKTDYQLQPALKMVSKIIHVKKVYKNEKIGYGATWQAEQETWVGTVPIGYADGYLRGLQGFHVLIKGQFCEIIGRICMDQLMVELPEKIQLGEKVTLIGEDCGQKITVQDLADQLGTINYEVICLLNERIPRIFTKRKKS